MYFFFPKDHSTYGTLKKCLVFIKAKWDRLENHGHQMENLGKKNTGWQLILLIIFFGCFPPALSPSFFFFFKLQGHFHKYFTNILMAVAEESVLPAVPSSFEGHNLQFVKS